MMSEVALTFEDCVTSGLLHESVGDELVKHVEIGADACEVQLNCLLGLLDLEILGENMAR